MNDFSAVRGSFRSSAFPASHQAFAPGRVPHVRGLSRTWFEHDLFPMLSPPGLHLLTGKERGGASPGFPTSLHSSTATYAAFGKESHTRFTGALGPDRKSGGSRGTCSSPSGSSECAMGESLPDSVPPSRRTAAPSATRTTLAPVEVDGQSKSSTADRLHRQVSSQPKVTSRR